jgi:hypothetical protein
MSQGWQTLAKTRRPGDLVVISAASCQKTTPQEQSNIERNPHALRLAAARAELLKTDCKGRAEDPRGVHK